MRTRHDGQTSHPTDHLASNLPNGGSDGDPIGKPSVTIMGMATKPDSLTFQLIEMKLGRPLRPWIRSRRRRGDSWRKLTLELYKLTDVDVTDETVRTWAPDQ